MVMIIRSTQVTLIIGLCVLVGFLLILVVGLGGVAAVWYFQNISSVPGTAQGLSTGSETVTEVVATNPDLPSIEVGSDDDRIQWIRINDSQGERVLSGSPAGEASLEPGTYLLRVKVVGRSTAELELDIEGELSLSCEAASNQRVLCRDASAELELELIP